MYLNSHEINSQLISCSPDFKTKFKNTNPVYLRIAYLCSQIITDEVVIKESEQKNGKICSNRPQNSCKLISEVLELVI